MDTIEIDAGTLLCSEQDLTATGLLVPFGVECRSSIGRFTVDPGVLRIPEDLTGMALNVDHDRTQPVALFASMSEKADGIWSTIKFANTPEGRQAFADAKSGKRKNLSVEAAGVLIRAGKATAGRIFGGATVERGAFEGAELYAAEDTETVTVDGQEIPAHTEASSTSSYTESNGEEFATDNTSTEDVEELPDGTVRTTRTTVTVTTRKPAETPADTTATGEDTTMGAVPQTLNASHTPATAEGTSLRRMNVLLAAAHNGDSEARRVLQEEGQRGAELYAALSDITGTGTPASGAVAAIVQPQWVGEAYNKATYDRRYVPLFAHEDLTGFSVQGFKWTTPPVMAAWSGNKTPVPSAGVRIDPTNTDAKGFAGAHDIDRRIRDFGFPEFWDGYWRHMSNSYRKLTDSDAVATVAAGATPVEAGVVPAGISAAAVSIVDGYLAIQDEGVPTFAVLAKDLWRDLLLTPREQTLEYLSVALNLDEGSVNNFRILPARSADLTAGTALVGIGQAATVYELPGSPLRVEGLDMVKGGIDPGAFGYEVTIVEDAAAFALVSPNTP